MRGLLYPGRTDPLTSVGLLLLRLVVGAAFVLHGWGKIEKGAFNWMGEALPGSLQFLAVVAEFGGGIALLLGLLTRPAALGLAVTMTVAAGMVHIRSGHPFVATGGPSWELAAVYLVCSILFLLKGPGLFSLDALLFGRRSEWPD